MKPPSPRDVAIRRGMRDLDRQIDIKQAVEKKYAKPMLATDRASVEGARIAREIDQAVARMVSVIESFLEKTLETVMGTLKCGVEDIELNFVGGDSAVGALVAQGEVKISVKGVHVMDIVVQQLDKEKFQLLALPIGLTEEEEKLDVKFLDQKE